MTNEEAIKTLEANYPDACYEQLREAVNVAIKALEAQDAAGDTISRRAAIEALNKEIIKRRLLDDVNDGMLDEFDTEDILRKLPPAQPQRTGRWINQVEDGYVECPFCHSATNCEDNISDLHFCFSCGARMEGE